MADMATARNVVLIGAPIECGAGRGGCAMGPAALRLAGIEATFRGLEHNVRDMGDLSHVLQADLQLPGQARNAGMVAGWTRVLANTAEATLNAGETPIFLGGDHALAMGSVSGAARHADKLGRPLHVLWLDAHTDYNTPLTSPSGNMHGMPVAFFCGEPGFDGILPADRPMVLRENVHLFGIRSIDPEERAALVEDGISVTDMRKIDEFGAPNLIREIIEKVEADNGLLHVSLDVDFLDPDIAPGVGTTVPGGATLREGHLVMEILCDCGLVTSLDLVELNPYLDDRGKSARLMVDMAASLFGKRVFDRPTRANH